MSNALDLEDVNKRIIDRNNVFYWQTDRDVSLEAVIQIWADRHGYFTDTELLQRVNEVLMGDKVVSIVPMVTSAQTNLGNVNSVRVGVLANGKNIIIRCHPKGVKNGYFHVEALVSQLAKKSGLPAFDTLAIHDFTSTDDFAFMVIEKLPGFTIKTWLETHSSDEHKLVVEIGKTMAQLHKIPVDGFGPFDNTKAKDGTLVGLHDNYGDALRAGLDFNLTVLEKEGIITGLQSGDIRRLFSKENEMFRAVKPVLVHNDFADWNLLTDGHKVTGVLDWDECVGGDPIMDIACWSTFFEPERVKPFLEGYWQVAEKPADFEERFELYRLRYVISKMTLRTRRYSWDPSPEVKLKIENGKLHLSESIRYFNI